MFSASFIIFLMIEVSIGSTVLPNIVFILTDDQDLLLGGMEPMTQTQQLIGNKGTTFQNAFVNSPICCPSRSSMLTGKYLHNIGVRNNSISGNCSSYQWQEIHEPYSIASILKSEKNYTTFYAGKYLNQYGYDHAGGPEHVPVGYDWWIGLVGNSKYYNYTLSLNGTAKYFQDSYLTDVLQSYALNFLNHNKTPFFMTIGTPAPHKPFTPADRHKDTFPNMTALRTPSFNFSTTDKHWLVEMPPYYLPTNVTTLDTFQQLRMQTLLAVDELVESVILKLQSLNILDNTYVIFSSDNGFHLGQFTQPYDKRQPYETDIRVPFLMRGPGIVEKTTITQPVSMVDVAATILEIAGVQSTYNMDGKSFLRYIRDDSTLDDEDKNIFLEYVGEGNEGNVVFSGCEFITDPNVAECQIDGWCKCSDARNNTFVCVRRISKTENFKYCRFFDRENFIEAYNLSEDPYELKNVVGSMTASQIEYYEDLLEKHIICSGDSCDI